MDIQSLSPWIEQSLRHNRNQLSSGYQGKTLLYDDGEHQIVIKTPHGRGLLRYLHTRMLRHEYEVYRRLQGHPNIPQCHGLIDNRYLAIRYVPSQTIRQRRPAEDSDFYALLLQGIQAMHQRGVAHMDLKRKENLLVDENQQPVIIDFGASVIFKPGFHPFNHFWYRLAKRFDYNAWIKHKYMGRFDRISTQDRAYYQRSWLEKLASKIKRPYLKIKRALSARLSR